jgi:hypothetical protein
VSASRWNHKPASALDGHGSPIQILHSVSPQIKKCLEPIVNVLAQFFDTRHVLIQGEAPQSKSRDGNFEIFQEDGLQLLWHDKNDIGFVRMQYLFFSPDSIVSRNLPA